MRDDWVGPNVAHDAWISQNKKFNVICEISYCMPVKPDSSCKICGTHEFFVALHEIYSIGQNGLNSAVSCILCITFLYWSVTFDICFLAPFKITLPTF